jgi:transposase
MLETALKRPRFSAVHCSHPLLPHGVASHWCSAAAGRGSAADVGGRRLDAFDTYGGPLLHIPPWSAGTGQNAREEEETSGDSTRSRTSVLVASTCTPAPWSLCILTQDGEIVLHRPMKAAPDPFLKAIAPDQEDRVVCVECRFTWYWLADLCAREGMPFVRGPALDMQALHGGTATNDTIDSQTIAVLLHGGRLPQAYVYPAARRATRDLLRRRVQLTRQRAALLAHGQQTNSQDNLPEIGKKLASKANRDGVAARCPEPAVPKSVAGARALIDSDAQGLRDVELPIVQTATPHHAQPLDRRPSVPGIGQIVSLGLRDEIHDLTRFPRVQDVVSSGRLVTWAKASAGQRSGTAGATIGKAYLTWAVSEAAVLCWRNNPAG